jgi:hypothetical protein
MAAAPPEKGKNTLLVTHKPNILDAFGKDWFDVKEGEASVFRPTGDGKATLVARLQAAEWISAAKWSNAPFHASYTRTGSRPGADLRRAAQE